MYKRIGRKIGTSRKSQCVCKAVDKSQVYTTLLLFDNTYDSERIAKDVEEYVAKYETLVRNLDLHLGESWEPPQAELLDMVITHVIFDVRNHPIHPLWHEILANAKNVYYTEESGRLLKQEFLELHQDTK